MPTYTVESGVSIPGPARPKLESIYPYEKMEVGDSFVIPKVDVKAGRSRCSKFRKLSNNTKRFCARAVGNPPVDCRIWRIK